jgi:hypothetical protein
MPGNPFIGLEGERGGQATEGYGWQRWWRHDGGGSSRFRRGSIGAVVGSDEGVVLLPFRERKGGCQKVAHEHTHEASSAVWPEEEDDRAGPTCW